MVGGMRTGHLESFEMTGALNQFKPLSLARFLDSLELLLRRLWFGRVWVRELYYFDDPRSARTSYHYISI